MEVLKFALVLACAVSLGASVEGVVEAPKGSLTECHLCETVAKKVYERAGDDLSEKSITYALDHVCNDLTFLTVPFLRSKCRTLVSLKLMEVVELFVAKTDPSDICQFLLRCEKKPDVVTPPTSVLCSVCEKVVDKVYYIIGGEKTESNVARALDLVCDNFFVSLVPFVHRQCKYLVDDKLRHVIYLFLAGMQANELCYELYVCGKPRP